ncbi:MAG: Endoribonuclease YbeY [Verrucomicrobiae bacterium]|nr:Endoribonuclease YbeY [Verrucomicrobiae bacterium]
MTVTVANRQRTHKVNVARLKNLVVATGLELRELSIVLVGDAEMARLNLQYHNTPGTTDVLTFDYGDGQGELIICVDRAHAQARQFRTTPAQELALYVVHGVLHLQGYDDLKPPARRRMRAAERRLLAGLDFRGVLPLR